MAGEPRRITELDPASVGLDTDVYPVAQAAGTRKQTRAQLRAAIFSGLQAFMREFLASASPAAAREKIQAAGSGVNADITRITALNTPLTVAQGGTGASTSTGAGAVVLADSPALITPTATTPTVGTNSARIATAAMLQAEIANKRAWTAYNPTVVASSGAYTTVGAVTGSYMVAFGICYVRISLTITTVGTGANPRVSLPVPALAGSSGMPMSAAERAVNGKSGVFVIEAGLTTGLALGADTANLTNANGAQVTIMGSYPVA